MRLFLPSARATNVLLIVGFCALGYAFYMRYLVIEQSTVSLACEAGLNSWLCTSRTVVTALFTYLVFGWAALIVAALNLLRPGRESVGHHLGEEDCYFRGQVFPVPYRHFQFVQQNRVREPGWELQQHDFWTNPTGA